MCVRIEGAEGSVPVVAGQLEFLQENGIKIGDVVEETNSAKADYDDNSTMVLYVAVENRMVCTVSFTDPIRKSARKAIRGLQALGIKVLAN